MIEPLPTEIERLQQQLLAERQQHAAELAAASERVAARDQEIDRLAAIIKALQRHRFGRRSEQLDADQLMLGLEDTEQTLSAAEAAAEKSQSTGSAAAPRPRRKINRGALPEHLPREEVVLDVADLRLLRRAEAVHRRGRVAASGPCRRSSRWSSRGAPSMPAAPARARWCRRRHQPG